MTFNLNGIGPDEDLTPNGSDLLDRVLVYLCRFVAFPTPHAAVAHVLWIAHTHLMDRWDTTPRIAFLSPEPGSGKSRCLEVTEPLVPRPVHSVNVTPAYLFRKVSDPAGPPTILFDEVDAVFGAKVRDGNEEVRGMLNAGHRRGATAGRCVGGNGTTVGTEELPAYCAVALAGLHNLPDTIMSRAIVVRMRRRAPHETIEPFRIRVNGPEGRALGEELRVWAATVPAEISWPELPEGIEDRNADVWEPIVTVADLVGDRWPERARVAAVALVADSREDTHSIGVQLLTDLKVIFASTSRLHTQDVLNRLRALDESPWGDHAVPIDPKWLARELRKYGVKPKDIKIDKTVRKGYAAADLRDPWSRYVHPGPTSDSTP